MLGKVTKTGSSKLKIVHYFALFKQKFGKKISHTHFYKSHWRSSN